MYRQGATCHGDGVVPIIAPCFPRPIIGIVEVLLPSGPGCSAIEPFGSVFSSVRVLFLTLFPSLFKGCFLAWSSLCLTSASYLVLSPSLVTAMSRTLEDCDAILDLMCDCCRMSVEKTRWYGVNVGRRFKECGADVCGFHKWIDPPLCSRSRDAIRELQDRHSAEREEWIRRRDALIEWYTNRLVDEKRKFKEAIAGLSILCDVVKDLVLEATDSESAPQAAPPLFPGVGGDTGDRLEDLDEFP